MHREATGAENTLPEQEAPSKSGRPPPIVISSTTNFIWLQGDLKELVKREYEFRNTRNGTRTIRKELEDYSTIKSYLEKNSLQHFTFSPNSEKPIGAVIRHLPQDTLVEDISNSFDHLCFNIINVRQLTTNRIARYGKPHMAILPQLLLP
jgi:hypothetical protein